MGARKWISISVLLWLPLLLSAQTRYNPFAGKPQVTAQAQSTDSAGRSVVTHMRLKAVLPEGTRPMANIDGQIVAVGDRIDGYVLRAVGEQSVTLESSGRLFQLHFKSAREAKEAAEKLQPGVAPGAAS